MCAVQMDSFKHTTVRKRDPALRLSNASEIKSIINSFERRVDSGKPSRRMSSERPSSFCGSPPHKAYYKEMVLSRDENIIYNGVDVSNAIIPRSPAYEVIENEWDYTNDRDKSTSLPAAYMWRGLHIILYCLSSCLWLSHIGFAIVIVAFAMFAPKAITQLIVYPCCRLLFGTLYPAYASYKAVRTKNVKEYVKWMMYWIVFALFTCVETFTDVFFSWFPFYYEVKIILVFWLLSPATKGSSILYRKFVHPALCRREQEIDECISKAKEQGYHTVLSLGTKGVNYATNVIMQTAIKSGGGLVQQLRKSYSLSDLSASDDHTDGRTKDSIDEINSNPDHRLVRRNVTVRTKGPRATSSPRVEMFFSEVDVNMAHGARAVGGRDGVNLEHIQSSEDISYLYNQENSVGPDSLVRTSSVGSSKTRSKTTRSTFTTIKRPGAAEDDQVMIEEIEDDDEIPFYDSQNQPNDLHNNLSPEIFFEQYLKYMNSKNQILASSNDFDLKNMYNKYLQLKEVFDSSSMKSTETESKYDNKEHNSNISVNQSEETGNDLSTNTKFLNETNTIPNNDIETPVISKPIILIFDNSDQKDESMHVDDISDDPQMCSENIKSDTILINNEGLSDNNSDGEIEENFTTPNDSPILSKKVNKSPKSKKRQAPPPPSLLGSLEDIDIKCKEKLGEKCENNSECKISQTDLEKSVSNVSLVDSIDSNDTKDSDTHEITIKPETLVIINDVDIDKSEVLVTKQDSLKNKAPISKSKNDTTISKILNLPSKLAFWNKSDVINVSDSDTITKEIKNKNTDCNNLNDKIQKLETLSDSTEKLISHEMNDYSCKENQLESASLGDISNISTKSDDNIKILVDEIVSSETVSINSTSSNINEKNISPQITYIPLKPDPPIIYLNSKSTDV